MNRLRTEYLEAPLFTFRSSPLTVYTVREFGLRRFQQDDAIGKLLEGRIGTGEAIELAPDGIDSVIGASTNGIFWKTNESDRIALDEEIWDWRARRWIGGQSVLIWGKGTLGPRTVGIFKLTGQEPVLVKPGQALLWDSVEWQFGADRTLLIATAGGFVTSDGNVLIPGLPGHRGGQGADGFAFIDLTTRRPALKAGPGGATTALSDKPARAIQPLGSGRFLVAFEGPGGAGTTYAEIGMPIPRSP